MHHAKLDRDHRDNYESYILEIQLRFTTFVCSIRIRSQLVGVFALYRFRVTVYAPTCSLIYDTTKDPYIPGCFAHTYAIYAAHKLRFRRLPGELAVAGWRVSVLSSHHVCARVCWHITSRNGGRVPRLRSYRHDVPRMGARSCIIIVALRLLSHVPGTRIVYHFRDVSFSKSTYVSVRCREKSGRFSPLGNLHLESCVVLRIYSCGMIFKLCA